MITTEQIKELLAKATSGEWHVIPPMRDGVITQSHDWWGIVRQFASTSHATGSGEGNARFIAALPDIAQLCLDQAEEIKRLKLTIRGKTFTE